MGAISESEGPVLGVLISGGGRTLVNLADAIDEGALRAKIGVVLASKECDGVQRALNRGLAVEVLPADVSASELESRFERAGVEWIVLAGYLRLLPPLRGYEGRVVNIHPALLPEFGGPGMYGDKVHESVLASGARTSGCTVHICNDRYDEGPVLAQATCEVFEDDTVDSLASRVFDLECELYPRVLEELFHRERAGA